MAKLKTIRVSAEAYEHFEDAAHWLGTSVADAVDAEIRRTGVRIIYAHRPQKGKPAVCPGHLKKLVKKRSKGKTRAKQRKSRKKK